MAKKNTLGRGLDSLLGVGLDASSDGEVVELLNISDLESGTYQPRVQMDDDSLKELAESIKEHGIIQPILVRKTSDHSYEIIAGERRWRASQLAGLVEIPAIVREISDENALAIGLIENIQRQNLNPIEEAQGLFRLKEEFGLTHERIASAVGRSRSSITNTMRLLNLPEEIQEYLIESKLDMGHARAIITLPVMDQLDLAHKAVKMGWSVREIERRANRVGVVQSKKTKDLEIQRLEEQLSDYFGMKVDLREKSKSGSGVLSFNFTSYDELNQLLSKIQFKDKDKSF
ncbi:ParB/RepB/Spo0J family partition protein [Neisseriaceae bacterium PsAf]|nr:ParB/RepB/Spo0J family partition protein [Neisseriaceae bacterium PsAf]